MFDDCHCDPVRPTTVCTVGIQTDPSIDEPARVQTGSSIGEHVGVQTDFSVGESVDVQTDSSIGVQTDSLIGESISVQTNTCYHQTTGVQTYFDEDDDSREMASGDSNYPSIQGISLWDIWSVELI